MGFVSSYLRWGNCYFLLSKKGGEFNWGNWIILSAVLYSRWLLFYFHYQIKSNSRGTYFCKYSPNQQKTSEILTWTMFQYIKQLCRVLLWPFCSSENVQENTAVVHVCSAGFCSFSYMKMFGLWKTLPRSKIHRQLNAVISRVQES